MDESIIDHLGNWKGKKGSELAGDDDFFDAIVSGKLNISNIKSTYTLHNI